MIDLNLFDQIPGLKLVDPALLAEYERTMNEEVIPKIIEDMKRRAVAAEKIRHKLIF